LDEVRSPIDKRSVEFGEIDKYVVDRRGIDRRLVDRGKTPCARERRRDV
jgi:hypothetical protein